MTEKDVQNAFTYHPPTAEQTKTYEEIRFSVLAVALYIRTHCPESRERSLALTKLREAVMWANASIACNS
jgi:hypothetical protein